MANVHLISRKIIILLLFLINLTMVNAQTNSSDESDALLRLKVSFDNAGVLESWQPDTSPCNENQPWEGIRCSEGSVQSVRLEGLNLSGIVDIDALLQIPILRTVSFMSNSFSGDIPPFNKLVQLRALYLSNNQFSGGIPDDYFVDMKNLKKLWLSWNRFSGPIPSSLDLIPLVELYLENNQFSGSISQLDIKSIEELNFSNNNLAGPIPVSLSRFDEKTFAGNPGLCGTQLITPCVEQLQETPPPPNMKNEENDDRNQYNMAISLWMMLVCAVVFLIMIIGIIYLRSRQMKHHELTKEDASVYNEMNESERTMTEPKINESGKPMVEPEDTSILLKGNSKGSSNKGSSRGADDLTMVNDDKVEFGISDLMKSAAEVLGNGTIGSSYKAMMSNGFTVVVKRIKDMDYVEKDVFDTEIRHLANINHKNVLAPLAYHYRKEEKLLITEYMPKRSLLYVLHGDRGSSNIELKWQVRLNIIQGIANGLFHIHTKLSQLELPHGNLKSSNVLLNTEYEPLLSDYGFSSLATSTQAKQALFAYKTPEALQNQSVSPKCDVYCMGIIILELLTAKFPSQYLNSGKGGTDVVQWARSAILEETEVDILDPEIGSSTNSFYEMKKLLHIGVACTESEPEDRLDMSEAISRIEALQCGSEDSPRQNRREGTSFKIS